MTNTVELNRWGYPVNRIGLDAWSQMMKRENDHRIKEYAAEGRPDLRPQEILEVGHEIDLHTLSRQTNVGKIGHLAEAHGWLVKVGESKYRTAERWVKGEVVPGKEMVWRWVQGISPDRRHHFLVRDKDFRIDGIPVEDIDEVKISIDEWGSDPA